MGSACLAARVSGGLKSRSARGHGSISNKWGVMPHWPKCRQVVQMPKRARRRKPDTAKAKLEPATETLEGRAPTARWGLKGMRRTTGS